MKINRSLKLDHETISHFVTVLGSGVVEINGNKHATAEFFISARNFIDEYIEKIFFEKEALLIRFLQEIGFSPTGNPISSMIAEQEKSRMLATQFTDAVHLWQEGDEVARTEIAWYAGEYISTLTAHLQRLKTIVIPLLEQNITPEEED